MSIIEYNMRIFIGFIIAIIGSVCLIFDIKKLDKPWVKTLLIVTVFVIIFGFLLSMVVQIAYSDKTIAEGQVENISIDGSFAGFFDSYTVSVKKDNGQIVNCHTSIFTNRHLKLKIEEIEIHDVVLIKGTDIFWNMMYDIEKKIE